MLKLILKVKTRVLSHINSGEKKLVARLIILLNEPKKKLEKRMNSLMVIVEKMFAVFFAIFLYFCLPRLVSLRLS